MIAKQFHDEAVATVEKSRLADVVADKLRDDDENRATIPPLTARLLLNGWITDKGKVYLDGLAPEDCLTFLIDGKNYIHPEGLELFPFEVIETTTLHGGEAIFSHRYRPESSKASYHQYRIFSAVINPREADSIILGLFGPEHQMGKIDEDCEFARLVNLFRKAYAAIKPDLPTLRRSLKRTEATVMVDRATGRVITLNQAALKVFKRSDKAMVDIGLDQLKYHIAPLLTDYNLKMENVSAGQQELSIVTLHRNCGQTDCREKVMGYLSSQFTTLAANISELSENLAAPNSQQTNTGYGDRMKEIQKEVDRFSLAAKQFAFLVNYERREYSTQDIMAELERAISDIGPGVVSRRNEDKLQIQTVAPVDSYYMLFDSILREHAAYGDVKGDSRVSLEAVDSGRVRISFGTYLEQTTAVESVSSDRHLFVAQLADSLGIEVLKNLYIKNNEIVTELILKK